MELTLILWLSSFVSDVPKWTLCLHSQEFAEENTAGPFSSALTETAKQKSSKAYPHL